jgi:hypothetical protein
MLSCKDLAHKHASDYVDGQLGWNKKFSVWFHLLICVHCRRFVIQLRRVPSLLAARPSIRPLDSEAKAAEIELGERLAEAYAEQKDTKKKNNSN